MHLCFFFSEISGVRNVVKYDCCPDVYVDVTYTFHLNRRPLYYAVNLLVPCILVNAMAVLVFLLPAESGERISFGK